MNRENKIREGKAFFESFDQHFKDKAEFILSNLKVDSSITKEDVINLFLEFFNRGGTSFKFLYPCIVCKDSDVACPSCDALVSELNSYKNK